jgi:hypothetical protein
METKGVEKKHGLVTHGLTKSATYSAWKGMLSRCYNKNNISFKNYGGRGIIVCQRWLIFENFLTDMGIRPDNLTLDRIKNDGNYEPSNCKWASIKEQSNNRRTNRIITFKGQTKTMQQWAEELNIYHHTLRTRLYHLKWSVDRALTTPIRQKRKYAKK